MRKGKQGFTLLELVVSIFLIAIVLGTVLLLMAANLNVMDKANDILIANALSQYTIEDVRNIDFPPVYYDRQSRFGDRPVVGTTYKSPEAVDPVNDGDDWTPAEFQDRFIVRRYDFRYADDGIQLVDATQPDTDLALEHRIYVYVLRQRDRFVISQESVVISRNGLF